MMKKRDPHHQLLGSDGKMPACPRRYTNIWICTLRSGVTLSSGRWCAHQCMWPPAQECEHLSGLLDCFNNYQRPLTFLEGDRFRY